MFLTVFDIFNFIELIFSCVTPQDVGLVLFCGGGTPVKPRRLTNLERSQFELPENLKEILVGLLLGDLFIQSQSKSGNVRLFFEQGIIHKDYLYHLFDLFKSYCSTEPKGYTRAPDKRTGNSYSRLSFKTYSLPCFKELHTKFYLEKVKVIPLDIVNLLTPLSLAYWICDDGNWVNGGVHLHTNSYTLEEVNLLVKILNEKFNFKCTVYVVDKNTGARIIRINAESVPQLQALIGPIMPSMMRHKIFGKS